MASLTLHAVVERDDDAWRAYVPELEGSGASTWAVSREDALRNLQEVAQLVVEDLHEQGAEVPASAAAPEEATVTVTL